MNATLKYILTGAWMNNPLYHVQIAHALGGAFVVLVAILFGGLTGLYVALGAGVPLVAAKEFVYDILVEVPHDTWKGSAIDFMSYMIGASVATGLALIKLLAL